MQQPIVEVEHHLDKTDGKWMMKKTIFILFLLIVMVVTIVEAVLEVDLAKQGDNNTFSVGDTTNFNTIGVSNGSDISMAEINVTDINVTNDIIYLGKVLSSWLYKFINFSNDYTIYGGWKKANATENFNDMYNITDSSLLLNGTDISSKTSNMTFLNVTGSAIIGGTVNATKFYGSFDKVPKNGTDANFKYINATNMTLTQQLITPRIRLAPNNLSYLKLGDIGDWGGSSEAFVLGNNEPNLDRGDIIFLLYAQENLTGMVIQSGLNNSAGIWGNSLMIMPNDMALNLFSKNLTNATNCINVYDKFNKSIFHNCDTAWHGASGIVQGSWDVWRGLKYGETFFGFGTFDVNLQGNDAAFMGGAIHIEQIQNATTGFELKEERNAINERFVGSLGIMVNDITNTIDWFLTPQPQPINLCDDEECAKAIGGFGNVVMNTTFSTLNMQNTTLNFVYSIVGLIGTDTFTVETDNGTGWETQLSDAGTDTLNSQSIVLGSDYWNASTVHLRVTCGATKADRECYIDTIRVNGSVTLASNVTAPASCSEICFGDGSRDSAGRCNFGLFHNCSTGVTETLGPWNITGTVIGGISGAGAANNIVKWSGTTSITSANIVDTGSLITMGSDVDMATNNILDVANICYSNGTNCVLPNSTDINVTRFTIDDKVNISNSGDVNATKFYGDGSALTGITGDQVSGAWVLINFTEAFNAIYNLTDSDLLVNDTDHSVKTLNASQIGIGTTIPIYLLQVAETTGKGLSMNVSDVLYVNGTSGNVGIGTESPETTLVVVKSGTPPVLGIFASQTSLLTVSNSGASSINRNILVAGPSGNSEINFADTDLDIGGISYFHGDNSMTFRLNNAARMSIASNGDITTVGDLSFAKADPEISWDSGALNLLGDQVTIRSLGSDSPRLHIAGVSGGGTVVDFGLNSDGELFISKGGTGSERDIIVQGDGDVILADNGNVGIGTNSPKQLLHINSSTAGKARVRVNEGATGGINFPGFELYNEGVLKGGMFYDEAKDIVSFFNDGTLSIVIDTNQNVGIGTDTPASRLVTIGDINATGKYLGGSDSSTLGPIFGSDGVDASEDTGDEVCAKQGLGCRTVYIGGNGPGTDRLGEDACSTDAAGEDLMAWCIVD